MTKLPENEKSMFHMIREICRYYIIDIIYAVAMIYYRRNDKKD